MVLDAAALTPRFQPHSDTDGDANTAADAEPLQREPAYACGHCHRAYKYKDSLTRHVRQAHSGAVFACRICGKSYKSGNALHRHCKLHSDESLLRCTECGQRFVERYRLVWHMAFDHRGELMCCAKCNRSFRTVWGYKRHSKVAHGEPSAKLTFTGGGGSVGDTSSDDDSMTVINK